MQTAQLTRKSEAMVAEATSTAAAAAAVAVISSKREIVIF